jgi:HEAT repeat protein
MDDDETVEQWYTDLLVFPHSTVPSKAVQALLPDPDPRAKEPLLETRWKDQPDVVPHAIQAVLELNGEDTRDALLDMLWYSDEQRIRTAAVEALANYDDDEVREKLQALRDNPDENEAVREAASESLEKLDD